MMACSMGKPAGQVRGAAAGLATFLTLEALVNGGYCPGYPRDRQATGAGFTGEQAEAVTGVVRHAQALALSEFATKADLELGLAAVRADLEKGLATVRADLGRGLAETKTDILRWMVTTIGVQTVVILGAMVSFIRPLMH
jgi:hypothetical protein